MAFASVVSSIVGQPWAVLGADVTEASSKSYSRCPASDRGAVRPVNDAGFLPVAILMRPMKPFALALPLAALAALPAHAQTAADPAGSSPILAALNWVQGTLLGNVATSAAVIAIAAVGFLMLTGRIEWRRGLVVIVGAFIIFGAASIVAGIRSLATGL